MSKQEVTPSRSEEPRIPQSPAEAVALMGDADRELDSKSRYLAANPIIPESFRGKPLLVFAALTIAKARGIDPFFVMANLVPIHGRFGWNGAGMIGLLRASGGIKGTLHYEREADSEDGFRVRAWAIDKESGEKVWGIWVSMRMAQAENWTKNQKYKTMPEVMLTYRAATLFVRMHYPDALMGFQEVGEVEDLAASGQLEPRAVDLEPDAGLDDLNAEAAGEAPRAVESEPELNPAVPTADIDPDDIKF